MAYNEQLADRIRLVLQEKNVRYNEKNMFGGICFMVDEKMCLGIVKEELMARVGPHVLEEVLHKPGAKPMDFTGRPMKGYVFVEPAGLDRDEELAYWVQRCLDFNPEAKASKKKKGSKN